MLDRELARWVEQPFLLPGAVQRQARIARRESPFRFSWVMAGGKVTPYGESVPVGVKSPK